MDYLAALPFNHQDIRLTLLHVFRRPTSSEYFINGDILNKECPHAEAFLSEVRESLIKKGFAPNRIKTELIIDPYPTVTEGIIDRFKTGRYDMIVIGRKKMSKAEEFVMGDVSVKLVRALENTGILVVDSSLP